MDGKVCKGCGTWKSLDDFHVQSAAQGRRKTKCKVCIKNYDEARYAERKDELREQQKESRAPGGVQYETRKAYQDARNRSIQDLPNAAEINKRNNLRRYNITLEQYNEMLEEQNHCCAVCGRHKSLFTRGLHVDHDHNCCPETGRSCGKCIRGLLCHHCNAALGAVRDNIVTLNNLIAYLNK